MKLSGNRLKMAHGEIRKFKSSGARNRFERVAETVKYNKEVKDKLENNNKNV